MAGSYIKGTPISYNDTTFDTLNNSIVYNKTSLDTINDTVLYNDSVIYNDTVLYIDIVIDDDGTNDDDDDDTTNNNVDDDDTTNNDDDDGTTNDVDDLPIVVLHGVASSAKRMDTFCKWLHTSFQRTVFNIEIGTGVQSSIFMPLNKQLDLLCDTIYGIDELKDGFDFIGMSQGGLLGRGYVERCNKFPVRTLVNLVSPNGGVIEDIDINLYSKFSQEHLSISGYWRDPKQLENYLVKCSYLPIINNEFVTELSEQYKQNMLSLTNFVVVWSPLDDIINPPESAKFSVFDKDYNIVPLEFTSLYMDDLIGLRELNDQHKFFIYETNCSHTEHRDPICFGQLYDIFSEFF